MKSFALFLIIASVCVSLVGCGDEERMSDAELTMSLDRPTCIVSADDESVQVVGHNRFSLYSGGGFAKWELPWRVVVDKNYSYFANDPAFGLLIGQDLESWQGEKKSGIYTPTGDPRDQKLLVAGLVPGPMCSDGSNFLVYDKRGKRILRYQAIPKQSSFVWIQGVGQMSWLKKQEKPESLLYKGVWAKEVDPPTSISIFNGGILVSFYDRLVFYSPLGKPRKICDGYNIQRAVTNKGKIFILDKMSRIRIINEEKEVLGEWQPFDPEKMVNIEDLAVSDKYFYLLDTNAKVYKFTKGGGYVGMWRGGKGFVPQLPY